MCIRPLIKTHQFNSFLGDSLANKVDVGKMIIVGGIVDFVFLVPCVENEQKVSERYCAMCTTGHFTFSVIRMNGLCTWFMYMLSILTANLFSMIGEVRVSIEGDGWSAFGAMIAMLL